MRFGYVFWLPETELIAKFVENLKKEKLMGTRCKKCSARYLPPRAHCRCGSRDMEWFEASRLGRILTYTIVTYPPESMSKYSPYIVAIAELKDGTRILAQLTGATPKTLNVGMPVEVVSHKVSKDRIVYKFKPLQQ